MIRLVILDFDDTIVDNRKIDYQGFIIPFKKLGVSIPSIKQITKFRRKGKLAMDIALKFLKDSKRGYLIDEFLGIRSKFLHSDESINHLYLKKNTKSLLNMLKRNKVKCVLCSVRTNKKIILNFVTKNKIHQYFQDVILMEDLGFKIDNFSPSNRILIKSSLIHKIIKNNKIKLDEIVFVGNSVEDLEASNNMKIPFIYYQNSYLEELEDKKVIKVTNMTDLKKKIQFLQRGHL